MLPKIQLSTERIAALSEAERLLGEVDKEYDKAEACGIDCQQLREIRMQYGRQIETLKANYAPTIHKRTE